MSICHPAPCERLWKMWPRAVILVLFLEGKVSSQSVTSQEAEASRPTRQLNFGECCPCSDSEPNFRSQDHWLNSNTRNLEPNGNGNRAQFSKNGFESFRSNFDDCPCRQRTSDSEGSSSIFFPSALRPNDPSLKSGSKEDPKNLLEPEVGLASSVLETLKRATDEEYREALARDSARAKAAEDAVPEESAPNIVTIILPNQDDEDLTSGSHIQEPRCIRPLGSPISRMRTPMKKPPNVITEIFRLPRAKPVGLLHRHNLDIDSGVGASNILERVVDAENGKIKLKTNRILLKNDEDVCETNFRKGSSLKSVPLLEKEVPEQNNVLRSSNNNNPKIRLDESPRDVCNTHNTDLKSAASDTKELFARPELKLGYFTPESPLNLKSLLKLRDVEILPPAQLIEKLKLGAPPLQLPPLIENMPKLSDLLKNGIKFNLNKNGQWNNAHDGDDSIESSASNIQIIPREKAFTTEILDGLPSTSNINEVKYNEPETLASSLQSMPVDKTIVTESSKSLSRSTDANNGNSHDVFNNPLQKISNMAEEDCHLLEGTNGDATSNELNLSRSNGDVPTSNIESQEDIHLNARSDEADQELDASDRFGTIESEQKSAEDDQQESPSDDVVFNSNRSNQNSDEEKPESQDKQTVIVMNDNKKLGSPNASPLGKSLTSVREAILRKREERKRPTSSNKAAERRETNDMEVTPIPRSDIEDTTQDCQNEATRILTTLPDALNNENINTKSSKALGNVQFSDLQRLSDVLLKKSMAKEKSTELIDDKLDPEHSSGINNQVDKLVEDTRYSTDSGVASDNQFARVVNSPSNRNALQINNDDIGSDNKEDKEETCSIDLRDAGKSLGTGPDVNEMAAEASEPVIGTQWHDPLKLFKNSRLNSPLFQDVIVQPTSLFDGIGNTPSIDLPGTLNLPTLDDIRDRLANVFSIQAKDSSDEEFDCMNENPIMAAAPSTSKFISKSPAMPLEDLNLDIFQLKPLSMGKSSALSKTPGLNLKSFRTKIPVPKNLDFKPVRLQSTVGNNGGLLGAALSLGRNEDAPKLFDSLGNSLQNLPTLEEMMSRMRSNVENIVSPLDSSRSSSSTPLISDFSNNIRSNAENTIRALQSRMRSSLGQTNNVLTNSARSPHELIERIADAKEDLDAKFKGLQYDLNDRITSIHENLLDKTVLPSLNPLFQEGGLSRHAFDNQNTRFKTRPAQASKKFKSESKKDTLSKTANFKNKLKTNTNASPRTFKMPTAASVPVPKTVEVPKLKSIMDKSLSDIENNMKMKPISSRTNPLKLENKLKSNNLRPSKLSEEHSALGKQASPLKKNKVKVTFGSTTPAPISTLRSQERTNSNFDGKTNDDLRRTDNGLRRRFGLQQKSNVEPHESPSEVQPIFRSAMSSESSETPRCDEEISSLSRANDRIFEDTRNAMTTPKQRTNLKAKLATSDISRTDNGSGLSRSLLPLPALPKIAENTFLSKVREAVKDRLANFEPANPLNSDIPRTGTDVGLPRSPLSLPSWPKIADNSFLSKVKEVVKDRVTNFDPLKPLTDAEPKTSKTCADMERSASQNTDIAHIESLKENVSYQCKMVCTKS